MVNVGVGRVQGDPCFLVVLFVMPLGAAAWAFTSPPVRPNLRLAVNKMSPLSRASGVRGMTATGMQMASAGAGMVFGEREVGKFADAKFGNPVVRRYREKTLEGMNENWRMWYHGRDIDFDPAVFKSPSGRVGLAESPDGITWTTIDGDEHQGAVLDHNKDQWWGFDTTHCGVGDVQGISTDKVRGLTDEKQGSVQFMYLFGGDGEEVDVGGMTMGGKTVPQGTSVLGLRMRIGLALSFDGVHWTRLEGDHHSGALFDVGAQGEWDNLYNAWPSVVQHSKNDFRMYYTSFDPQSGRFCIGLARSQDGIKWRKEGKLLEGGTGDAFDARGCSRRCVVADPLNEGGYLMYAEGINAQGMHSIGLYKSQDGLVWSRHSDLPILQGSTEEEAWDRESISCPWIVPMAEDGSCRLYYSSGGDAGSSGIGMAVSLGKDWTSFTKYVGKTDTQ